MDSIAILSTIHCPSFQFSEIDLSQLLYSFWRVGIIMSKLKNKLYSINYIINMIYIYIYIYILII